MNFTVRGNLVDIPARKIYAAEVMVAGGNIEAIIPLEGTVFTHYIIPGFIDAHVHVESSMLIPAEFARLAVVHGTIGTVSDPHEIANVCGMEGVEFMIANGKTVPFKFCFGAPSCVPATGFETAGAVLSSEHVEELLKKDDIAYLTEVMNFPGVLAGDDELIKKIETARRLKKPVDGHAPGLRGKEALIYANAGITTDHECFTEEEALEKLSYGMKIQIREGSAAKNFDALVNLLHSYSPQMMFCSDDKHPDNLASGHINKLCARAVARGIDVFDVLQVACVNPVIHYGLRVGLLKAGDPADFLLIEDLRDFNVIETYVDGRLVAERGMSRIPHHEYQGPLINNFWCTEKGLPDFKLSVHDYPFDGDTVPVIEVSDGQLVTQKTSMHPSIEDKELVADPNKDMLKIAVVNRYYDAPVAKALIKNFGLKRGAIASSIAHDSHNIIVVAADDESMCRAVNLIIKSKGGISLVDGQEERLLALPVAGLMSHQDGYDVARKYSEIDAAAKSLGSGLSSPYMTLSFMALLVIPALKISDKGLFDGESFSLLNP